MDGYPTEMTVRYSWLSWLSILDNASLWFPARSNTETNPPIQHLRMVTWPTNHCFLVGVFQHSPTLCSNNQPATNQPLTTMNDSLTIFVHPLTIVQSKLPTTNQPSTSSQPLPVNSPTSMVGHHNEWHSTTIDELATTVDTASIIY